MKGFPFPNSCGGGSEQGLIPPPSGLFVFGEVKPDPVGLHGEGRLLENALGKDGDLPKDKTGEERSDRL